MAQMQLIPSALNLGDVVYTPDWVARDMVQWFAPSGKILEPCIGKGAIFQYLPVGSDWCEIERGRDFFAYTKTVDWIISNPPYGTKMFSDWLEHSFSISKNIVYLLPVHFFFRAGKKIERCRKDGWIKHVRFYGNGNTLGFPMGNPIAAMHFIKGYQGDTSWSWYFPNAAPGQHKEVMRVCINPKCGWVGKEDECLDYKHPVGVRLCPDCYEVTEEKK